MNEQANRPPDRGQPVWRDMDQVQLDKAYDQMAWASNFKQIFARRLALADAALKRLGSPNTFQYGLAAPESLDFYRTESALPAPVVVFVHGGGWLNGSAKQFAHYSESITNAGAHYAILDFSTLPQVDGDLGKIVDQVRRGVAWLYEHVGNLGGDRDRIYLAGHSSGAHLAATAAMSRWDKDFHLPSDVIKGAVFCSGIYDLAPVLLSSRSVNLRLTDQATQTLSPLQHVKHLHCPATVICGTEESPEFQRQAQEFVDAARREQKQVKLHIAKHYNHFEVGETFSSPYEAAGHELLELMGLSRLASGGPKRSGADAAGPVADPASKPEFTNPNITRSCVMTEIASALVKADDQSLKQAMVMLRNESSGSPEWRLNLFASNSGEGIDAVVAGRAAISTVNPCAQLALAYRGSAPYTSAQPVRNIAVIPSLDQYVFAVRPETGLKTFEDIVNQRYPLRVSLRGQADHSLHHVLGHIMEAVGFTEDDLRSWGGEMRREGTLPFPGGAKFDAIRSGKIDAIFDEAVEVWLEAALSAGLQILSVSEATLSKLAPKGLRRGVIEKQLYPQLPQDVVTVDFSGFPIFVHADAPDALVTAMCAGLEGAKQRIPWQGYGPLPTDRMCRDETANPMDVPLHPAAEQFWRKCGYLPGD